MEVIKEVQTGLSYGGNPLACKVAIAALELAKDKELAKTEGSPLKIIGDTIINF
ncbi:hypothetical protein [Gracilimonas halophila]|uniref:Uncharacterized protein n=1 Tax=Gracilimonas halophila TaxID=1834464 RepID=A0ABW5JJU6_9BACT